MVQHFISCLTYEFKLLCTFIDLQFLKVIKLMSVFCKSCSGDVLECGPMPNVMAALLNIGGAQYWSAVQ